MNIGVAKVRSLLPADLRIDDAEIRDTLWYYYYDTRQSVSWLLGT